MKINCSFCKSSFDNCLVLPQKSIISDSAKPLYIESKVTELNLNDITSLICYSCDKLFNKQQKFQNKKIHVLKAYRPLFADKSKNRSKQVELDLNSKYLSPIEYKLYNCKNNEEITNENELVSWLLRNATYDSTSNKQDKNHYNYIQDHHELLAKDEDKLYQMLSAICNLKKPTQCIKMQCHICQSDSNNSKLMMNLYSGLCFCYSNNEGEDENCIQKHVNDCQLQKLLNMAHKSYRFANYLNLLKEWPSIAKVHSHIFYIDLYKLFNNNEIEVINILSPWKSKIKLDFSSLDRIFERFVLKFCDEFLKRQNTKLDTQLEHSEQMFRFISMNNLEYTTKPIKKKMNSQGFSSSVLNAVLQILNVITPATINSANMVLKPFDSMSIEDKIYFVLLLMKDKDREKLNYNWYKKIQTLSESKSFLCINPSFINFGIIDYGNLWDELSEGIELKANYKDFYTILKKVYEHMKSIDDDREEKGKRNIFAKLEMRNKSNMIDELAILDVSLSSKTKSLNNAKHNTNNKTSHTSVITKITNKANGTPIFYSNKNITQYNFEEYVILCLPKNLNNYQTGKLIALSCISDDDDKISTNNVKKYLKIIASISYIDNDWHVNYTPISSSLVSMSDTNISNTSYLKKNISAAKILLCKIIDNKN